LQSLFNRKPYWFFSSSLLSNVSTPSPCVHAGRYDALTRFFLATPLQRDVVYLYVRRCLLYWLLTYNLTQRPAYSLGSEDVAGKKLNGVRRHKNRKWFTTPLLEALAVFGTAAIKKIISMAAWDGIIFFIAMRCWLFNIMLL
jgi:hypothetical protein